MDAKNCASYLRGLFDAASSVSVWMGPSYVYVAVFDNASFADGFRELFRFGEDELEDSELTSEALLREWFGDEDANDKKLVRALSYHIEKRLGKAQSVRIAKEKHLTRLENKNSPVPFTSVEDMAVIRFAEYTVCLVTGNNE
ncbi:MAG: hypothetical protein J6330_01520 [Clostridia bacterium]|nr:hypothetical protein [Clostridia bacterium]